MTYWIKVLFEVVFNLSSRIKSYVNSHILSALLQSNLFVSLILVLVGNSIQFERRYIGENRSNFPPVIWSCKRPCLLWVAAWILEKLFQMCEKAA